MCTNYTPATPLHLIALGDLGAVPWPSEAWPQETYPGYLAPLLMTSASGGVASGLARFGLIPRWCRDGARAASVGRGTYNARTETVAEKPSFRGAWRESRFALAPMLNFFEPCWETGRPVRWRIQRVDGEPLLAAALQEHWRDPQTGESVRSFSLLTANADGHPVLGRMHRTVDEKRQMCLVPPAMALDWLSMAPSHAVPWLAQLPVADLEAQAAPLRHDPQAAWTF